MKTAWSVSTVCFCSWEALYDSPAYPHTPPSTSASPETLPFSPTDNKQQHKRNICTPLKQFCAPIHNMGLRNSASLLKWTIEVWAPVQWLKDRTKTEHVKPVPISKLSNSPFSPSVICLPAGMVQQLYREVDYKKCEPHLSWMLGWIVFPPKKDLLEF